MRQFPNLFKVLTKNLPRRNGRMEVREGVEHIIITWSNDGLKYPIVENVVKYAHWHGCVLIELKWLRKQLRDEKVLRDWVVLRMLGFSVKYFMVKPNKRGTKRISSGAGADSTLQEDVFDRFML